MSSETPKDKIGHGLAKVLGIKLDYRDPTNSAGITRGESVFSVSSADTYVEQEPTVLEWFQEIFPSGRDVLQYFRNLFPFLNWIGRYNLQWFIGDLVAGITVGAVVVPQSMAYAKLAQLPVQAGLYSSFMGVLLYWFFATSKDITIGPVAVMSTVTGTVVLEAQKKLPGVDGWTVATALAVVAGGIVTGMGLLRIGWLVEFISLPAIAAFMTGSALNIAVGQVPGMMGITGFSTRDATYKVVINILTHLNKTTLDAALGLTALTMLYLIRYVCNTLAKRFPAKRKTFFFVSTLRTSFVILLYILIAWAITHNDVAHKRKTKITLLGTVPRGFTHAKVPEINAKIVNAFVNELPVTVIVLLIEHISISKSFGRVNNYQINPSQELVAIGVSNLLGPFLGAYPATGSFSRTAIKSKAGVRTPFAGVITAIVVLLAIYALPAMFYYIPNAALAGVIIHAVGDLVTPPNTVYEFWRISPIEVPIFFAGVFVTVFSSIENGIYTTVTVSAALFLWRAFKARGRFMGKVQVHSVIGDHLIEGDDKQGRNINNRQIHAGNDDPSVRNIFLPLDHHDGHNPLIEPQAPYPGVFMFRFSEGYNYPNANHYLDYMVDHIFKTTRRTNPATYGKPGDRPWNNPGPRKGKEQDPTDHRPTLKAIILDFSSVNNVDLTSVQHLIDVRNQLDLYSAPDTVEWHFACINNRWTKRALAAAGFGYPTPPMNEETGFQRWKPVFSVAEIGGADSAATAAQDREQRRARKLARTASASGHDDIEAYERATEDSSSDDRVAFEKEVSHSKAYAANSVGVNGKIAVVAGINRPLFHIDLTSALQSAVANVEGKQH